MCFSATASFVAGVSLSVVGIATIKKTKKRSEIPLAAAPLIFGIQQCIEGFVWLSLGWGNPAMNAIVSPMFYFFSNVWWPIFVPFAILMIEPSHVRRRFLMLLEAGGIIVGLYYIHFLLTSPVASQVMNACIVYSQPAQISILSALYVLVTCGACFASSHKMIRLFAIPLTGSLLVAYLAYTEALVSVWCFFAAILSIIIYFQFSKKPRV